MDMGDHHHPLFGSDPLIPKGLQSDLVPLQSVMTVVATNGETNGEEGTESEHAAPPVTEKTSIGSGADRIPMVMERG